MQPKTVKWYQKPQIIIRAIIGGVVLALAWLGWWLAGRYFFYGSSRLHTNLNQLADHQLIKINLANVQMQVELVNRPGSVQLGLSGRDKLGSDGMLFVLPVRTFHTFWMVDMQFPLDILYFDNNTLVEIMEHVPFPAPNTPIANLPLYTCTRRANIVLELPAGHSKLLNLKVGDKLQLGE